MKTFVAFLAIFLSFIPTAHAECYGDAANAFGCGIKRGTSEGTLSTFGNSREEVIPDYGSARTISVDDLFTPQEQMRMYKNIILGQRGNSYSHRAFFTSMQAGSRPIRRFGNLPFARPRF